MRGFRFVADGCHPRPPVNEGCNVPIQILTPMSAVRESSSVSQLLVVTRETLINYSKLFFLFISFLLMALQKGRATKN